MIAKTNTYVFYCDKCSNKISVDINTSIYRTTNLYYHDLIKYLPKDWKSDAINQSMYCPPCILKLETLDIFK